MVDKYDQRMDYSESREPCEYDVTQYQFNQLSDEG